MSIIARRPSVKNHAAFTVRVPPELKAKLEEIAYEDRKALGAVVEEMLADAAEKRGAGRST